MKIMITGGCGFLGSNIASKAIREGHDVLLYDNLQRLGAIDNLAWLKTQGTFTHVNGDIRNTNDVSRNVQRFKPEALFNLAGQVAMTTSIDNPRLDFETNVLGTFNVLEAIRMHAPEATVVYSSTNKVYGDLEQYTYEETETRYRCLEHPNGFPETVSLEFHSPYGCSKGAADQYMLDYARIFDLNTVVFRHSSMYGGRQFATFDQGWVGWFCQKALEQKRDPAAEPFTISGNGKQVRDVLHADDMIRLYFLAVEHIGAVRGQAFNIGGGIDNSLSLLELFQLYHQLIGVDVKYRNLPIRQSDQRFFVADIAKAERLMGWMPQVSPAAGVAAMLEWLDSMQH